MKSLFFILLALALPVNAEVFKCVGSDGLIKYQPTKCMNASLEKQIDIKARSPKEEAASVENLREWTARYDAKQKQEEQAEKERVNAKLRADEVDALQRNASAQSDNVASQNRQARAMEDANRLHVIFGQ